MTLTDSRFRCTAINNLAGLEVDWKNWFLEQADTGESTWLLAHLDDGVIWGAVRDGRIVTSDEVFPNVSPPFRLQAVQQARFFGRTAEVRVWREGVSFKACRIEDESILNAETDFFDEEHLLWGTRITERRGAFVLVGEGSRGIQHAVPLPVPDTAFQSLLHGKGHHPLRLGMRHYVVYDADGRARIALSRLTGVFWQGKEINYGT